MVTEAVLDTNPEIEQKFKAQRNPGSKKVANGDWRSRRVWSQRLLEVLGELGGFF